MFNQSEILSLWNHWQLDFGIQKRLCWMYTLRKLQAQHDFKPTYQDKLSKTLFPIFKSMRICFAKEYNY